jgi:thiamine-phosphate pyrophosphorylase
MITDRRQVDGNLDALVARVAAAARAGVSLIQVRERDLDGGALLHLVARCVDAVGSSKARVLVNDRLDVALAAGAHGVHLRGDSLPAVRVRELAPAGFLVGRSVHDAGEARRVSAAGGLDYLMFGPVYETASKPGRAAAGLAALRSVAAATPLPVLAVGGMSPDRALAAAGAGAAGFAAIGFFAASPDRVQVQLLQAGLAFDTPPADP